MVPYLAEVYDLNGRLVAQHLVWALYEEDAKNRAAEMWETEENFIKIFNIGHLWRHI